MEMKSKHEEIALRRHEVDSGNIKVLKAEMERMKKEHAKDEKKSVGQSGKSQVPVQ